MISINIMHGNATVKQMEVKVTTRFLYVAMIVATKN